MKTFVELPRAREVPALAGLDEATLIHVLEAACSAVQNYCNRAFLSAAYDEFHQGTGTRSLFLRQFPVTQVRVRHGRQVALQIVNSTQLIQAATVEATTTGLVLKVTNNAVTTANTLTWATCPTIGQLGTAVTALGNGWSAIVSPAFSSWASSDLSAYAGVKSARTVTATYAVHYFEMSDYLVNGATGELVLNSGWHGPYQAFRIIYTAGYDTIPDELVQATCELASATYQSSKADPNLQSESLGQYSYTRAATKSIADLSVTARQALNFYRKPVVPFFAARGV